MVESRGYPSLYQFLVGHCRYSEGSAYRRFRAAKAANRHPSVLVLLRNGELTLRSAALLQPHLREHGERLLDEAKGKTTREVEALVARLDPRRQPPDSVRVISVAPSPPPPETGPSLPLAAPGAVVPRSGLGGAPEESAAEEGGVAPPGGGGARSGGASEAPAAGSTSAGPIEGILRVRFSFTADSELWALVKRARELLRHKHPGGRLEAIFKDALRALLDRKDPDRRLLARPPAASAVPPPGDGPASRRIPQAVKDAVWRRDGGRCAYPGPKGRRCASRDGLEYDHIRPWALGGRSDEAANIRLLCRSHNRLMARRLGLSPPGAS